MTLTEWALKGVAVFFEYDTPKIVHIKSKRIGIMSRLVQLVITSYVIGFVLVHKKGYQETDAVVSAVTTKMKGNVRTNFSSSELVGVKEEWKEAAVQQGVGRHRPGGAPRREQGLLHHHQPGHHPQSD